MTEPVLQCPACGGALASDAPVKFMRCGICNASYPVINEVPILICQAKSIIDAAALVSQAAVLAPGTGYIPNRLKNALRKILLPEIGMNWKSRSIYQRLQRELLEQSSAPRVLVIGGGEMGDDLETFFPGKIIRFVETDVYLGPRIKYVCDAHDLPFTDASFDGVIIQAVLEHVVDPARCVTEIHRVLKPRGIVYSATPFMQQVHMRAHDFTRFTDLGHRRLFRYFEEIDRGVCGGPGMALAWSIRYFFSSFSNNSMVRAGLIVISSWLTFWLKYLDYFILETPGGYDAASSYYFIGRKQDTALSDQELLKQYRGFSKAY